MPSRPPKVLIFRIGSLGDTLISVPALHAVREHFKGLHLTMLCDDQTGKGYVTPPDVLGRQGLLVDEYMNYAVNRQGSKLARLLRMGLLAAKLRLRGFDTLVYLVPTGRKESSIARDRKFFALAGIKRFIGMEGPMQFPKWDPGHMPVLQSEGDLLLARMGASGIKIPPPGQGNVDIAIGPAEDAVVEQWLAKQQQQQGGDAGRRWIAIGPGSKMPSKLWPAERYQAVVAELIRRFDVWPVVFGGKEDRPLAAQLIAAWGRGHNAAGELGIRPAMAALKRCALYLGNDTGTMHMAAMVGVPCVAIFASRDFPGLWHPYGPRHTVLRTKVECEGCFLESCVVEQMRCVKSITEQDVLKPCEAVLSSPVR